MDCHGCSTTTSRTFLQARNETALGAVGIVKLWETPLTTAPTELSPLVLQPGDRAAQSKIRLPLPIVLGNRDYKEREELLRRMDEVLVMSGVEQDFIDKEVAEAIAASERHNQPLTDRRRATVQHYAKQALRCTMARILSTESHRKFSCQLAESPLLQWFCACAALGRAP